jgi:hypothetical protein
MRSRLVVRCVAQDAGAADDRPRARLTEGNFAPVVGHAIFPLNADDVAASVQHHPVSGFRPS